MTLDMLQVGNSMTSEEIEASKHLKVKVPPHSCKVYKVKAEYVVSVVEITGDFIEYDSNKMSLEESMKLIEAGAVLVDVRDKDEYNKKHLEGALHIPYSDIHDLTKHIFPDKNQKIVLYCNIGKNSNQAARSMHYMRYCNVEFTSIF